MESVKSAFGSIMDDALANSSNLAAEATAGQANITVIGCGGAGNNMVSWLYKKGVQGARIIAVNTDQQHLDISVADSKLLIGENLTKGLGCGGYPHKGKESARESMHKIRELVNDADMVFICAGLGGGTGTGAAPVIAEAAKSREAIVIGAVTLPFSMERARIDKAEFGLQELRKICDTVIIIDNNRLVEIAGELPIQQAFAVANEVVSTMIKGIVEIIAVPSLVNLDYADVRAIMSKGDISVIGIGESDSQRRCDEAVNRALTNPLLEISYNGANGALIHVTGGSDMTLDEVEKIGTTITEALDVDANVVWGARIADDMKGKIRVMTIVTGVSSPYLTGRCEVERRADNKVEFDDEIGIDRVI